MQHLTIEEYQRYENDGKELLPYSILWGFQPMHFKTSGYSFEVTREAQLMRFLDCMSAGVFDDVVSRYVGQGLTSDEFSELQKLVTKVVDYTTQYFGQPIAAPATAVRSFNVLRHIKYLFDDRKLRVLEVGPGSGFLTAFLRQQGHSLVTTDVSQGFYLIQNRLWNALFPGEVIELASPSATANFISDEKITHIPWWKYSLMREKDFANIDVVTCNHVLCEMHNWSMRFTIRVAEECFKKNPSLSAFIFEGWGDPALIGDYDLVEEAFAKYGFIKAFSDSLIAIFVPSRLAMTFSPAVIAQKVEEGRRRTNSSITHDLNALKKWFSQMSPTSVIANDDDEFFAFLGGNEHGHSHWVEKIRSWQYERIPQIEGSVGEITSVLHRIINMLQQNQSSNSMLNR